MGWRRGGWVGSRSAGGLRTLRSRGVPPRRQSGAMTKKTILPLQLLVAPDKNDPKPLILYHGRNCPDGFGAALAAWLYYGDSAEYVGLDHGDVKSADDLPPLQGRAVYILDFSFAAEVMAAIDERAAKLVMLDHHTSPSLSCSSTWKTATSGSGSLPRAPRSCRPSTWKNRALRAGARSRPSRPSSSRSSWCAARPWTRSTRSSAPTLPKARSRWCSTASPG